MLSCADAEIVRRDSALPGLAALLNDEVLLASLRAACPSHSIGELEITYVRYRPGVTCLVGCRLNVWGSPVAMHARAYAPDAADRIARASRSPAVPTPLGPGHFVLGDAATVVSIFPNDRRVTSLAAIGRPDQYMALLNDLFPASESLRDGALAPLAYRPERGFVGKLTTPDGLQAVLKLYSDRNFAAASEPFEQVVSRGSLRTPRVLARSNRHRALVFEWLKGTLLHEAIQGPAFEVGTMSSVGEALAELHGQNGAGMIPLTPAAIAESLRVTAAMIGHLSSQLDSSARHLADRLGSHVLDLPPAYCRLHGDLHPRQVLLDRDAIGFLDFDERFVGDPALDLGSLLAYLEREVIRGSISRSRTDSLAQTLLEGYEAAAESPVGERVALAVAVGLFRLAPRCFRYREQDWPERMAALVARAEELATNVSRKYAAA